MNNLISLFILATDYNPLNNTLDKLSLNNFKNVELFIINLNHLKNLNNLSYLKNLKTTIIDKYNTSLFNTIFDNLNIANGDFICILNDVDINHRERFISQAEFLNENSNINICSCLEKSISSKNLDNNFSNDFISSESIDFAIAASYVPLDLYTFMIRKSLLNDLADFSYIHELKSELEFILFLLSYSNVEKIDKVLYYYKNSRIPYKECINLDDTSKSTNILSKFNRIKSLESREFMYSSISSIIKPLKYKIKYHILVFIESLNIGGTETYLLSISIALKKIGIESHIITSDGLLIDLFIKNNIKVIKLDITKALCDDFDFNKLLIPISKIINKYNIKLFTAHFAQDISICTKLKKFFKIPFILTIHGNFYQKDYLKNISKEIDGYIFVSDAVKSFYKNSLNLNNTKHLLFKNSIIIKKYKNPSSSLHQKLNIPKDSKILVYCSRLSHSKSLSCINFLKCFDKLSLKHKNIYAVVLGDGDRKIVVESIANNLNTSYKAQKIFILGSVYNVFDYYEDSFFVVGTGRVALEAISSRTAVIASGLAGCLGIVNESNIEKILFSNFADHVEKSVSSDLNSLESYLNLSFETLKSSMEYLLKHPKESEEIAKYSYSYCKQNLNLDTNIYIIDDFFKRFI